MATREYKKDRIVNKTLRISPVELYKINQSMKRNGIKSFSEFMRRGAELLMASLEGNHVQSDR